MSVYELWGMVRNIMCRLIMIVNELWGMCRLVKCKYDITFTSHINNIHQLTSRIDFGQKAHKAKRRSKKKRSTKDILALKGIYIG